MIKEEIEPEDRDVWAMPPFEIEASEKDWECPQGRHVYILEISQTLHSHLSGDVAEGKKAYYVGQTCKSPEFRLAQHCLGVRRMEMRERKRNVSAKSGKPFKKIVREHHGRPLRPYVDVWLRRDLMRDLPLRLDREQALELEAEVAARLEADGHWVHCN
ncbi:MAG: hypothetical protein NTX07_03435 [Solirubrobacterales bacterium]|nr:hypothetical protein [Solirubrobacterales bacterium]